MFPPPIRTGGSFVVSATKTTTVSLYYFVRSAIWVASTSAIILAVPMAVEISQIQAADDLKKMRQGKLFNAS